ncbi:hypothetical protein ACT3SZ_10545 [Corynebacterium sp. AOP40-9SA-29]|uniref:hypothetical protein n=1 Tax=Corynebacterium sp. AOP40-9SA-29 TaxID=3457677 RepID=UPI0040345841
MSTATTTTPTSTLFRYEWLRTRSLLGIANGLATLGVLLCSVLTFMDWTLFSPLAAAFGMMLVMAFTPVVQILLAVDYWRSSYGATGYLTQTLPVKGSRILTVKLLWAALVSTVSLVVTVLLGCVLYTGFSIRDPKIAGLGEMLDEFWAAFGDSGLPAWLIIGVIVAGYLAMLSAPVQYYFSISVGKERWLQTLGPGGPVLVFFLLGMVAQAVALIGLFVIPVGLSENASGWTLGNYSLLDEINTSPDVYDPYDSPMPLGFVPSMAILVLVCLWRTYYSWNRKIELE